MEEALVEALVTEVERGHRADSGYKKEAWEYTRKEVQRVAGVSKVVTLSGCKNKHDALKKDWKVWVDLTNQSGFGIGGDGVVTGPPDALDAYFAAHKDARKFRLKSIKNSEGLRQLFDGVLANGRDAVSVEELTAQSIESDPTTPTPRARSWSREQSVLQTSSRKRSASSSVTPSVRSAKRIAAADRIGRELGELAVRFEAFVAVMEKDYQRDAIDTFLKHHEVLHPALQLAVMEAFEKEFTAKAYCAMRPNLRRIWVLNELNSRREDLLKSSLAGMDFDAVMGSVVWDGDGDLVLKEAARGDGGDVG
jgi:hypothetical protein